MTHRTFVLFLALATPVAGCAEVTRVPDEPRYAPAVIDRRSYVPKITAEPLPIALRAELPEPATAVAAPASVTDPAGERAFAPATTAAASLAATDVTQSTIAWFAEESTTPAQFAAAASEAARLSPAAAPATADVVVPAGKLVEAKLAAPPVCDEMVIERMDGVRPVRQELSRQDKILMWTGYGGAGLVAVLTTIGMARGQDPGRGVLLFGVYGLPLAGLGAFQSWRSRTVQEPSEPRFLTPHTVGEAPCPKGDDRIPVRMMLGPDEEVVVRLSTGWTVIPGSEVLAARYEAESRAPAVLHEGSLTAFLGVPIPSFSAPGTSAAKVTLASAPATAPAATAAASPCTGVAVETREAGWLPNSFFAQELRTVTLERNVALEAFAEEHLGGAANLWQALVLNPGLAASGAGPQEVKVPAEAKPVEVWKSLLPMTCK